MRKAFMRKSVAIILVLVLVSSTVLVFADANNEEHTPKKDLLENMLNNRTWVLDVLVEGDYSTNPYIECDDFDSFSESSYGRFKSNSVNSALLDIVDVMYNSGEILSDALIAKPLEKLLELADYYGVVIPEANANDKEYIVTKIANCLKSLEKTREEKYYDYILSGMFTAQYSSEVAMSLEQEESQLTELETLKDNYGGIKDIISIGKNIISTGNQILDNYKYNYIEDILPIYSYSVSTYLDFAGIASSEFTQEMIDDHKSGFTEAMYTMAMCQKYDVDDASFRTWKKTLQTENILSKAGKVLKAAGETVNFANEALQNYIMIESLQNQRESHVSGLTSLSENTSNNGLKSVTNEYINLINKEYDDLTFLYKTGIDTLTNSDLIYDITSDFVKKKATNIILKHANVSTAKVVSKVASVLAAVEITTFLADIVTGVEETAKKVYQIEHTLKMIDEMKRAYNKDLQVYLNNKTDENAQKVIDDLLLLKRMRLFACKLTYDSASNQLSTPLGKLISNNMHSDSWKQMYQEQVDMLLSATINPVSTAPFELNKGEELFIYPAENYGTYVKNGKYYTICEISERMMGGLSVNGGNVYIMGDSSKCESFYISSITTKGNCVFAVSGGTNLGVYALENQSGELKFSIDTAVLNVYGFMYLNGKTEFIGVGDICVYGDAYWGSNSLDNVKIVGDGNKILSGTGSLNSLIINNTADSTITVRKSFFVNEELSCKTAKIIGGNLITLNTGGVLSAPYNGDITLAANTFDYPIDIKGSVTLLGETTFTSLVNIEETLRHNKATLKFKNNVVMGGYVSGTEEKTLLAEKSITVQGDMEIINSAITVEEDLILSGDYKYTSGSLDVGHLKLESSFGQKIAGGIITAKLFTINNTSKEEVKLDSTVYVSNKINNENGQITGSGFTIAESGCVVDNNRYTGNLTLNDYDFKGDNFETDRDLIIKGSSNIVADRFVVGGNFTTNDDFSIESKEFVINKAMICTGSTSITTENISVVGDVTINGDVDISSMNDCIFSNDLSIQSGGLNVSSTKFKTNKNIQNSANLVLTSNKSIEFTALSQNQGTIKLISPSVTCQGFVQSGGTLFFGEDSEWTINGNFDQKGTFTNNGEVIVYKDAATKINGGSLTVKGDLNFISETSLESLSLNGCLKQQISGSKVTVNELYLNNSSLDGVLVSNSISCKFSFDYGNTFVRNFDKISVEEVQ